VLRAIGDDTGLIKFRKGERGPERKDPLVVDLLEDPQTEFFGERMGKPNPPPDRKDEHCVLIPVRSSFLASEDSIKAVSMVMSGLRQDLITVSEVLLADVSKGGDIIVQTPSP
jgi:hypothetical protein